jgi:putative flippase GtrA
MDPQQRRTAETFNCCRSRARVWGANTTSPSFGWLARGVRTAFSGAGTRAKAARFVLIGLLSGATYIGAAGLLLHFELCGPGVAGVIGYVASMPANFFGNRRFSFGSGGTLSGDLSRYVLLHAVNIVIAVVAMTFLINRLELHYSVGLLVTVVIVPIANFIAMNVWVFGRGHSQTDRAS